VYGKDDRSPEELGQQDIAKLRSGAPKDVKMNNGFAASYGVPSHAEAADKVPQSANPSGSATIDSPIDRAKEKAGNGRVHRFIACIKTDPCSGQQ
jgi:hypothetical protein